MSETKKYFVARGPFRVPPIEDVTIFAEGKTVELDSAIAAQFVREGTLNPIGFECDGGGNPIGTKVTAPAPKPATPADETKEPADSASANEGQDQTSKE